VGLGERVWIAEKKKVEWKWKMIKSSAEWRKDLLWLWLIVILTCGEL
jgi:hypothetical protein